MFSFSPFCIYLQVLDAPLVHFLVCVSGMMAAGINSLDKDNEIMIGRLINYIHGKITAF